MPRTDPGRRPRACTGTRTGSRTRSPAGEGSPGARAEESGPGRPRRYRTRESILDCRAGDGAFGELIEHWTEQLLRASGYGRAVLRRVRPEPPLSAERCWTSCASRRRSSRPRLVVDLGSGTGSRRGPGPSGPRRSSASRRARRCASRPSRRPRRRTSASSRRMRRKPGFRTASADIVTCSQSFHWMEPAATLAEAARILRPGASSPRTTTTGRRSSTRRSRLRSRRCFGQSAASAAARPGSLHEGGHLERIRESGHFRYAREVVLHSRERGRRRAHRRHGLQPRPADRAARRRGDRGRDRACQSSGRSPKPRSATVRSSCSSATACVWA